MSSKHYLRKRAVGERYDIGDRQVDKMVSQGRLPAPFYLPNSRFPLWSSDELDQFDRQATKTRPAAQQQPAA